MQQTKNVVVVGAGYTGVHLIQKLSAKLDRSKYNLIFITPRPYFLHIVAAIRMVVTSEGKLEDRNAIPLDRTPANGNGTMVVGKVVSISDEGEKGGHVILDNGETVDYSILILASGSIWEGALAVPDGKQELDQWVNEWRSRFEKAEDILLVGGGTVGVEHAGEIKEYYPHKQVTIVHSGNFLLNDTYPERFRKDVEQRVRRKGVNLVLGDTVPPEDLARESPNHSIKTRNGKTLSPDLIITTRGPRPNTSFIGASLGTDILTSSGQVKVIPTLQLPTHPNIFAGGDIIDWKEQKQAGKSGTHADVITANVLSLLAGQKPSKVYKGSYELIVLTIGKTSGASFFGVLWGLMFGDWFSSFVKSKDLLVPKARAGLGYTD